MTIPAPRLKTTTAFLATLMIVCTATTVFAQDKAEEKSKSAASIDDIAWIAGNWQGEALGGKFEETWNKPFGGTMMGMFKLVQNDKVVFYELCTIAPKDDSFVLRIKHFHADMKGWEAQNESMEFPLVSASKTEVKFDGIVFKKTGDDSMHITVNVEQGTMKFPCERVK